MPRGTKRIRSPRSPAFFPRPIPQWLEFKSPSPISNWLQNAPQNSPNPKPETREIGFSFPDPWGMTNCHSIPTYFNRLLLSILESQIRMSRLRLQCWCSRSKNEFLSLFYEHSDKFWATFCHIDVMLVFFDTSFWHCNFDYLNGLIKRYLLTNHMVRESFD